MLRSALGKEFYNCERECIVSSPPFLHSAIQFLLSQASSSRVIVN